MRLNSTVEKSYRIKGIILKIDNKLKENATDETEK